MEKSPPLDFDDDEVLIERARYTRALSAQLKRLHDEAKRQGQLVPLDITENLEELRLEPVKSRQKLPRMIIHKTYPPSKASFDDLSTISLRNLTPHTPHTGKKLLIYTVVDAVRVGQKIGPKVSEHLKMRSSCTYMSVVIADKAQTDSRGTAILELYNCFSRMPIDECLPKGSTLRIREPYYTLTSAPNSDALVVRVDHPTDIEVIYPFAAEQPSSHWKRLGDAAYHHGRFEEAAAWLTKGLEVVTRELKAQEAKNGEEYQKLERQQIALLLNRAATRIEQGRWDECISDCNHILDHDYNFKAIYRRAKAIYSLGDSISMTRPEIAALFDHCKDYPEDKSAGVEELLKELTRAAQYGVFDWSYLSKLADSRSVLPATRYEHRDLQVTDIPKRGRGVVAKSLLKAGTLIVVSPATILHHRDDPNTLTSIRIDTIKSRCDIGDTNDIPADLSCALYRNLSKRKEMYELYAGYDYSRTLDTNDNTVDAFRMYGVQLHNSFDLDGSEIQLSCLPTMQSALRQKAGTGIWYYPSFFNHSCLNNCSRIFLGNLLVIKTSKEIQPGEELTLGYINKLHDYLDRKDCFYDFGFVCSCELCLLNEQEFQEHLAECEMREDAIEGYKQFAAGSMAKGFVTTSEMQESVVSVRNLIQKIRESYDKTGIKTMRYALLRPLNALCTLNLRLKNWSEALDDAKALLELSPPDHGMDDLTLGARTLVAALQIKISFNIAATTSQTLEINHSLATVVEAWNIRGLITGFRGYWDEFGSWWHDFLACSKVREDAVRQRILRAFLEASR